MYKLNKTKNFGVGEYEVSRRSVETTPVRGR